MRKYYFRRNGTELELRALERARKLIDGWLRGNLPFVSGLDSMRLGQCLLILEDFIDKDDGVVTDFDDQATADAEDPAADGVSLDDNTGNSTISE